MPRDEMKCRSRGDVKTHNVGQVRARATGEIGVRAVWVQMTTMGWWRGNERSLAPQTIGGGGDPAIIVLDWPLCNVLHASRHTAFSPFSCLLMLVDIYIT